MANCGCSDGICNCNLIGTGTVNTSNVGDTWYVNGTEETFAATSSDNTIGITPGGTAGHTPDLIVQPDPNGGLEAAASGVAIKIDPNSTAPVTLGVDGLRVDCCGSLWQNTVEQFAPDIFMRMGESSGTTAVDIGAISVDGTYNGTFVLGQTGSVVGDLDTAVDFDGSTSYLRVPYNAAHDLWTQVTAHIAFNAESVGVLQALIDNKNGNVGFELRMNASGNYVLFWGTGATTESLTSSYTAAADGNFDKIAVVLGPTSARLYVNGQLDSSNLATTYVPKTSTDLFVGSINVATVVADGVLDEFVVWPTALTDDNILSLYQSSTGLSIGVSDTDTVDLTFAGSVLSADVIPNTSSGVSNTASGVAVNIQGAPATVADTGENRLRFNASGELTYYPDGVTIITESDSAQFNLPVTAATDNQMGGELTYTNTRPYEVYVVFQCTVLIEAEPISTTPPANGRIIQIDSRIINGGSLTGLAYGTEFALATDMNDISLSTVTIKTRFRDTITRAYRLDPGEVAAVIPTVRAVETLTGYRSTVGAGSFAQYVSARWIVYPIRQT